MRARCVFRKAAHALREAEARLAHIERENDLLRAYIERHTPAAGGADGQNGAGGDGE